MEVGTTPGVLAGRYRVLRRLGSGGMATVYLAEDERLRRKVAIKQLHADSPADGARRFEREAKVGASLSHPSLVTVFDTVTDDEGLLIVMEWVEGPTLAQLMERGPVALGTALDVITNIASALDYAHDAGVVHRDVKPANILVPPHARPKLVDLGIATAAQRTRITLAGTVLGTPSYMAPEQLAGGRVTEAADIYALGVVASKLLSDPPPAAAAVLRRAMADDQAERPASAGRLARDLAAAFERAAIPPVRTLRQPTPRRGPPRWLPAAGIVLLLLAIAGGVAGPTGGGQDRTTAPIVPTERKEPTPKEKPAPAPAPAPSPDRGAQLHAQAHHLIGQGGYDRAIALEQQAIRMLAGSGRIEYWYALYDLGHALRMAGRPAEAVPVLEQRLQNPNQRDVVKAELKKARKEAKRG